MSLWSQSRLIDIMSNNDLSLVAEDFPEQDIEKLNLFPEEKEKWSKKRIAAGYRTCRCRFSCDHRRDHAGVQKARYLKEGSVTAARMTGHPA